MRYTTPTYLKPHGGFGSDGNFHMRAHGNGGAYPYHTVVCGVPLPNPSSPMPKPGHWRVSPRAKMRPKPRQHAAPIWVQPRDVPHVDGLRRVTTEDAKAMSLRARVREAVAAGLIAPEDAPSWARA